MKEFFKHYGQTVILLLSIIIGAIIGLIWKEGATVLSPFGDIFLNLMFVIIVPLVFLTISTSIARIEQPKRLGKIMGSIVLVIVITSIIAVVVGLLSTFFTLYGSDELFSSEFINTSLLCFCAVISLNF